MKNLALENYGVAEMSHTEMIDLTGGSGSLFWHIVKEIAGHVAAEVVMHHVKEAIGNHKPLNEYHDAMRESNHGAIR
jgi:hypothetical protein